MQNSGISLYQDLLPGISNVTLRIRYYGFYAWLATTYANRTRHTVGDWTKFLRRSEALLALTCRRADDFDGIAGNRWAGRELKKSTSKPIQFALNSDPGSKVTPYLRLKAGAFGAAYSSQLSATGVIQAAKDHDAPIATPKTGAPLAAAFQSSIGAAGTEFISIVERGVVSVEQLDRLAPLCPSMIAKRSTERDCYEQLLFGSRQPTNPGARERRRTLGLILKVTEARSAAPDAADVRWMLYANTPETGDSSGFSAGTPDLIEQSDRWWVYQANDLCHFAFEAILKYCVDTLSKPEHAQGVLPAELVSTLAQGVLDTLLTVPKDWEALVDTLVMAPDASDSEHDSSEASMVAELMPVASDKAFCAAADATRALQLLGILYRRTRERWTLVEQTLRPRNRQELARSVYTEMSFLHEHRGIPFRILLVRLVAERVIQRHLWIAMQKLRGQGDYTFLFESDEGRLRPRAKSGPVLTNPRLRPAISFLRDIGMLKATGLTKRGATLVGSL